MDGHVPSRPIRSVVFCVPRIGVGHGDCQYRSGLRQFPQLFQGFFRLRQVLQNVPQGDGLVGAGCLIQLFVNRLLQSLARLKPSRFAQLYTHRTVALALSGL